MRVNPLLFAFNQGEVSKIALARVDNEKLRLAAECQVNWTPYVVGAMSLRPGTIHVGEVLDDKRAKLLSFIFSKLDTASIELTDAKMRVRIDDVLVTRAPVGTVIGDGGFSGTGAWSTADTIAGAFATVGGGVAELRCRPIGGLARIKQTITVAAGDQGKEHGIRVVITKGPVTLRAGTADGLSDLIAQTSLDTGTHSIACTPVGSIYLQIETIDPRTKKISSVTIDNPVSGDAVPLELPTPWLEADLKNVRYTQSGDVIYVACYGQVQRKIERRSATSWSVAIYQSNDGPFAFAPFASANLTPSSAISDGILTSDRPLFVATDVGRLWRIFSVGQGAFAELGGADSFTLPVRVAGIGSAARDYTWTITGTWSGTLTFQRSFDGPDSGFVDVSTLTANGTISSATGGSSGTPNLDNAICWERIGFKGAAWVSGSAIASSDYSGGGGYGIVRVTGYTSPTQVDYEVLQENSTLAASSNWVAQEWSGTEGYPTCVEFHEGRLGWAGRDRFWLSASDDYQSYGELTSQGQPVGDAGPINLAFGYGPVDHVAWLLSLTRLLAGREQAIASIRSSSFDTPLTATNLSVKDCATQGAMRLPAVKIDKRGIYVQQSNRRVYALEFDAAAMDYSATDLTRLNSDIGKPGFVSLDVIRQPDTQVNFVRGDGMVAQLLFDPDDDVTCWTRAMTLGVIEDVMVLPGTAIEDRVYFVVRRTINGVTKRFIERVAYRDDCVGGTLNFQLDCAGFYDGAATLQVQIPWLPLTKVQIWADGKSIGETTTDAAGYAAMPDGLPHEKVVVGLGGVVVIGSVDSSEINGRAPDEVFSGKSSATLTVGAAYNGYPAELFADVGRTGQPIHIGSVVVSGGKVTLPNGQRAAKIIACLGFVAPFLSAKLAYGAQMGSPLSQRKKIDHVGLTLYNTHHQGLSVGQRLDVLDPLPALEADLQIETDTIWAEYDQQMIAVPGEWSADARLCLLAQAPKPCTIGAATVAMTTHEK